jgi:hypothetical protein
METRCVFSEIGTELFKYYLDEIRASIKGLSYVVPYDTSHV